MIASLFEQYQRGIFGYLARLVEDCEWAEDLAQETFFAAQCRAQDAPGIPNRRAWLYRIATDTAFSALKRRGRLAWLPWRRTADSRLQEEHPDKPSARRNAVERALIALPAEQRAPLLLYSHHGLSLAEVAEVFGMREGDATARLHRARLLFREAYEQEVQHDRPR